MKIAVVAGFSTKWNVDVNPKHGAKVIDFLCRNKQLKNNAYFCGLGMRYLMLIWLVLMLPHQGRSQAIRSTDTSSLERSAILDTNGTVANYWYYFPENRFVDSLRVDSLAARFAVGLQMQFPVEKAYRIRDKFDPFLHEIYLRKARGKTWFFIMALILIVYFIYYRAVFKRQFELRMAGLYKPYFFEDLMREQLITSRAGSAHAYALGIMVFAMGVMLYFIKLDFNNLNTFIMFIAVLIVWAGGSLLLYMLQSMFGFSMGLDTFLSRNLQRHININLFIAMVMLPVFLVAYYNGSEGEEQWLIQNVLTVLIAWISLRLFVQLFGIIRDGALNLTSILYFCSLEIIPYLLLIKFLQNSL